MKASFVVRNGTKAQENRIYKNEIIKDAINDTQSIIDSLNETKLTDYCTDGFKAAQLQKLIDVGLIAFDTPYVLFNVLFKSSSPFFVYLDMPVFIQTKLPTVTEPGQ